MIVYLAEIIYRKTYIHFGGINLDVIVVLISTYINLIHFRRHIKQCLFQAISCCIYVSVVHYFNSAFWFLNNYSCYISYNAALHYNYEVRFNHIHYIRINIYQSPIYGIKMNLRSTLTHLICLDSMVHQVTKHE